MFRAHSDLSYLWSFVLSAALMLCQPLQPQGPAPGAQKLQGGEGPRSLPDSCPGKCPAPVSSWLPGFLSHRSSIVAVSLIGIITTNFFLQNLGKRACGQCPATLSTEMVIARGSLCLPLCYQVLTGQESLPAKGGRLRNGILRVGNIGETRQREPPECWASEKLTTVPTAIGGSFSRTEEADITTSSLSSCRESRCDV